MERITTYLPNNLSFLRKQFKMTQVELGKMLGVGYTTIGNWENAYRNPDLFDIARLSKIFGVSADDLIKKDLEAEHYNIKKYTKSEVKEKVTHIVSNSELEDNKKQMIINVTDVACEE
jgi:transcriptional regulator with XRE-family HTH domain